MDTITAKSTRHPYAVYHATDILAMIAPSPQAWQTNRDQNYQHVANIYAELDAVFFLTNHTDGRNWTNNPEVFWVDPSQSPRSTSVGDVIYSPTSRRAWLVVGSGLQEIERTNYDERQGLV